MLRTKQCGIQGKQSKFPDLTPRKLSGLSASFAVYALCGRLSARLCPPQVLKIPAKSVTFGAAISIVRQLSVFLPDCPAPGAAAQAASQNAPIAHISVNRSGWRNVPKRPRPSRRPPVKPAEAPRDAQRACRCRNVAALGQGRKRTTCHRGWCHKVHRLPQDLVGGQHPPRYSRAPARPLAELHSPCGPFIAGLPYCLRKRPPRKVTQSQGDYAAPSPACVP